jgi:isobutyryl-CoA mutase
MAIQMIINREWGVSFNENSLQGSFLMDELTDLVEEAVLAEFERISERGGVLGAMETGYQRGRIQDESMLYEHRKHDGTLPIIGVNTFRSPDGDEIPLMMELTRAVDVEKQSQLSRLEEFQRVHATARPAALAALQHAALTGGNVFAVLMEAVKSCSLGEITQTLFDVGGRYRRNV